MGEQPDAQTNNHRHSSLLLAIGFLGFISIGLPDSIAGVAWPSVRTLFGLHQSAFGLVFIALCCGYCTSGFFGGHLMNSLGLGHLLWISSGLVAIAMFGFSLSPAWPWFVGCGVIWGLGSGGIDAGLNSYAAHHFSPRHVNWLHACYCIGTTTGPLMMTVMLHYSSWRFGYVTVGLFLLVVTIPFWMTRNWWNDPTSASAAEPTSRTGIGDTLGQPLVWLQMLLFFLHVGLEFTLGQWCFTILTESRNVSADIAGPMASCFYAMIGVGRIVAGVIAARVGLDQLIRGATLTAVAGTILFAMGASNNIGVVGLALAGLGIAPLFPCLMARTPQRLGAEFAKHAVGFQASSGMIGAAVMPGLAGLLSDAIGLEFVPRFAILLSTLALATHEIILNDFVRIRFPAMQKEIS